MFSMNSGRSTRLAFFSFFENERGKNPNRKIDVPRMKIERKYI